MAWPPVNHQDVTDAVTALRAAPPAHQHPVADITSTGSRSSTTFLRGDGVWALPPTPVQPITVVGTPTTPLTSAATARPTGALVVYWLMAAGVNPTNATGADLIWNAP